MKQLMETSHVLEMKDNRNTWHKPIGGMYRPAELLACKGRLVDAIEAAEEVTMEFLGNMHGISFRVVTTTRTITVSGGEFE